MPAKIQQILVNFLIGWTLQIQLIVWNVIKHLFKIIIIIHYIDTNIEIYKNNNSVKGREYRTAICLQFLVTLAVKLNFQGDSGEVGTISGADSRHRKSPLKDIPLTF